MPAPLHRCLTVWLIATAVAAALALTLLPVALAPAARFDELLVRACAGVGVLAAGWLWAVATAVALEARHGRSRVPVHVPAGVRRLLLAACGVAVVAGLAAPAGAASPRSGTPETAAHVVAAAIAGLPLPDRAHGRPHDRTRPRSAAPEPVRQVTIRPGDTLWAIAEERLGDGERWPELYALNRAVVGADPDLIRPAQRLRLPAHAQEVR